MLMIMEIVSKEFDLEQLGKKCTPLKLCLCDTVIFWYWGHKTWALQTMRDPRVSGSTGSTVGLRGSRGYLSVICSVHVIYVCNWYITSENHSLTVLSASFQSDYFWLLFYEYSCVFSTICSTQTRVRNSCYYCSMRFLEWILFGIEF